MPLTENNVHGQTFLVGTSHEDLAAVLVRDGGQPALAPPHLVARGTTVGSASCDTTRQCVFLKSGLSSAI